MSPWNERSGRMCASSLDTCLPCFTWFIAPLLVEGSGKVKSPGNQVIRNRASPLDTRFLMPDPWFWHLKREDVVRKIRIVAMAAATLASLAAAQFAWAQDFPTRPVRIVVAFPPGGPTDFVGRLVADKMTALLGQRVYIDNKPGANG